MDGKHTDGRGRLKRPLWREGVGPVLVASLLALGVAGAVDLINRHDRRSDAGSAKKSATAARRASAVKNTRRTAPPRFVVAVRRSGTAGVRDVRTGTDIGVTIAAPPGQRLHRVAAAGDGSYLVSGYTGRKVTFSRLRLGPDGRPRDFATVPRAVVPGGSDRRSDMAVSPDGARLAYVTHQGRRARILVVSTVNGARTAWTTRLPGLIGSLSWAGRTLSFVWEPARPASRGQVRTIDTAGRGGDLARSRPILRLPKGTTTAVLSRDGGTVLTGQADGTGLAIRGYSAATGQPTRMLWRQPVRRPGTPAGLTGLTPAPNGSGHVLVATADGRLFDGSPQGLREIPARDLADATW